MFNCSPSNYVELSEKFTVAFLIEKIKGDHIENKIKAAKLLTVKEDESTFPLIHQLLLDSNERVVSSTITFLKFMNREESSVPIFNILKQRNKFKNKKMPFYAVDALRTITDNLILDSLTNYNQHFIASNHYERSLKNQIEETIEFIQQFHASPESKRKLLLTEVAKINLKGWLLDKIVETDNNDFWIPILKEQSRGKEKFQQNPSRRLLLLKARIAIGDNEFNAEEQQIIKHYQLDKN